MTTLAANNNSYSPQTIEAWCDTTLESHLFKDYCPNGLQVDAGKPINNIVAGVTASMALIDAAIEQDADALLVHHGYFWKGEPPALTGMKGARVRKLMQHGISLLAYHLPLDAHLTLGNNAQLVAQLGLGYLEPLYPEFSHNKAKVGDIAKNTENYTADTLAYKLEQLLQKTPLFIQGQHEPYERIAICSGGAQDFIHQAAKMGCQAYISGEISERTTHEARELGIDYFACGHHATEKFGVQALGSALSTHFDIPVSFINIENPA